MNENRELQAVRSQLKLILKQKKLSYQKLAAELGVSEITVKRFFSSSDISFTKLQQICGVVGLSAFDLIALVTRGGEEVLQLSHAQEKALAENERLYDLFVLLLKFHSLKRAQERGHFKKEQLPKLLSQLAKLDLIELPVADKVPVRVRGALTWLKGGPLQKKFMRLRHNRYLDVFESALDERQNYLASSQRALRPESLEEMKRDLEFIVQKYRTRAYREEMIYPEEQLVGVAWLIGAGKYQPY